MRLGMLVAIVQILHLRRSICTIKHLAHKTAMPHCMHACTALHVSRGTLDRELHINNNMQYNAVPAEGLVTCLPQCFDSSCEPDPPIHWPFITALSYASRQLACDVTNKWPTDRWGLVYETALIGLSSKHLGLRVTESEL